MQARQVITCGVWQSEARIARIATAGRVGGVRGCGETCTKKKKRAHDVIRHKETQTIFMTELGSTSSNVHLVSAKYY